MDTSLHWLIRLALRKFSCFNDPDLDFVLLGVLREAEYDDSPVRRQLIDVFLEPLSIGKSKENEAPKACDRDVST